MSTSLHMEILLTAEPNKTNFSYLSCLMRTARTGFVNVNSRTNLSLASLTSCASSQINTALTMLDKTNVYKFSKETELYRNFKRCEEAHKHT